MRVESIYVETFSHQSEDESRVREALLFLFPFPDKIRHDCIKLFFGAKLDVLGAELDEREEIKKEMARLRELIDEENRKKIMNNFSRITNGKGTFCLKFDKQAAFAEKKAVFGDFEDCILFRIKIAGFSHGLEDYKALFLNEWSKGLKI